MPPRGPDLSFDMRLLDVSIETPDSEVSESMAVGLSVPLGRDGAALAANSAAYVAPTPDVPGCRLLEAACSPVTEVVAGRGLDPDPVAGRRLAGSEESPELASSLALRLPASRLEALLTLPDGVLRLPADTVGIFFFFWDVTSFLCRVDRALIKVNSSCLSMTLRQGRISVESLFFTAVTAATVALIAQWISQSHLTSLHPRSFTTCKTFYMVFVLLCRL